MNLSLSLRTRLVLSHLLVALLSIVPVTVLAGAAMLGAARENAAANLLDLARTSAALLELSLPEELLANTGTAPQGETALTPDPETVDATLAQLFASRPGVEYSIYLLDGALLYSSQSGAARASVENYPEVWQALSSEQGQAQRVHTLPGDAQVLSVAVRLEARAGNSAGSRFAVLRLEEDLAPALSGARRSLILLALAAGLVVCLVSLLGWALAGGVARPLAALTEAAVSMAGGDLEARTRPAGPRELHRLGEVFNRMAGRLQRHLGDLRNFVANASHELRTPLTVVKLRLEALRSGALEDPVLAAQFMDEIEAEVDRLGQMVDDMLDLSRIEAEMVSGEWTRVNLGVLAAEVSETFSIRAGRANVGIEVQLPPDLPPVSGIEDQLRQVITNLVDNALKYTPEGGRIDIILRTSHSGETVRLLVQDTGAGIPAKDLPHIFERFFRSASVSPRPGTSKGAGLGLAIARSIIENHGGKIGASSQVGAGATIWVELPVA